MLHVGTACDNRHNEGFIQFTGSYSSVVHAVLRFIQFSGSCSQWFTGSYSSLVHTVHWFLQFCSSVVHTVHRFIQGSCSSLVHTVHWFVQFTGSCSTLVHTVHWYNEQVCSSLDMQFMWFTGSYNSFGGALRSISGSPNFNRIVHSFIYIELELQQVEWLLQVYLTLQSKAMTICKRVHEKAGDWIVA